MQRENFFILPPVDMQADSTEKRMRRVKVFIFSSFVASLFFRASRSVSCLFAVLLSLFSLVSLSTFILFEPLHKNCFRSLWLVRESSDTKPLSAFQDTSSLTHSHTHPCTYAPQTPLSKTVVHVPRRYIIQPQTILTWHVWNMFYKDWFKLKVITGRYRSGGKHFKFIHLFFFKMFL